MEEYLRNVSDPYTQPGVEKMVKFSGDQKVGEKTVRWYLVGMAKYQELKDNWEAKGEGDRDPGQQEVIRKFRQKIEQAQNILVIKEFIQSIEKAQKTGSGRVREGLALGADEAPKTPPIPQIPHTPPY